MSRDGPRVAGIDPGTVSFDVCALDGGEVVLERSFRTADVGADPAPLVGALADHGPFELVLGPAGYGGCAIRGGRSARRAFPPRIWVGCARRCASERPSRDCARGIDDSAAAPGV